jgi:mycothiol synthase
MDTEQITCENLTDEIVARCVEKGYILSFAEEVMRYDLSRPLPQVSVPAGISFLKWTPERAHDFFSVYAASFRERPGYPGWSEAEWVKWTSDDPEFHPELSVLAVIQGQALGFVTNAAYEGGNDKLGYIIQVGILPEWRGKGLGAALTIHSLEMWKETGAEAVYLHVNANNPGAIRVFRLTGFVTVRQRGKFTPV